MALTERYVTHDASGGGAGTEGDPWTYAEGAAAAGGIRVNIKQGAYTGISGVTFATGTATAPKYLRGYMTTPGDLSPAFNADGSLNTTGFPAIAVTGAQVPVAHTVFECLSYSGSINASILGGTNADTSVFVGVKVVNTGSGSTTRAVKMDNDARFIACDFECLGATIGNVLDMDNNGYVLGCRIKGTGGFKLVAMNYGLFAHNRVTASGSKTASGVGVSWQSTGQRYYHFANTFYNLAVAHQYPNGANTVPQICAAEHVTDCGQYLDNLYAATADINVAKIGVRTRDITSVDAGVSDEWPDVGGVTTDTGGHETDYEDAANDDLRLISGAPGRSGSLISPRSDIGAMGHADPGVLRRIAKQYGAG